MRSRGLPLLLVIVLVFLALVVGPRLHQRSQLAAAVENVNDPTVVQVVTPHEVPDPGLSLPATLEAIEDTYVLCRSAGYIRQRMVDIGYRVKRGQLLCLIEAPDVDTQLSQAQAQTVQGQATVRQSQATADQLRATMLQSMAQRESGVAALQHAQAAKLTAYAQMLAAERSVDSQKATVDNDRAQMVLANREWQRYQSLGQQGFVTQESADQQQATFKSAQGVYHAAVATEEVTQANLVAAQKTLQAAESDVRAAQANLTAADAAVKAAVAAVRSGEETVQANVASADALRANEQHFGALTGFERVLAPFDGVIVTRNVDNGFLINPTSSNFETKGLFEEARTDSLLLNVLVPQTYVSAMHVGLGAQVSVRELPGQSFEGKIYRVSGGLDPAARTIQVQVRVLNREGRLLPGMYADVHFGALNMKPVIRVPGTAVSVDASGTRLLTVNSQDEIHFVPVTLGRDFGVETEVIAGLTGTEQVVNNPSDDLVEGLKVAPQKTAWVSQDAPSPTPSPQPH